MDLAWQALNIVRGSFPDAVINTLQGTTSSPEGVTSPRRIDQLVATFHTENGTATIQGAAEGMGSNFGKIQFQEGIIVGAPRPLNWDPKTGPAITALQADAMIKGLGVNTPYTALSLSSDDTPSLGPLNKGAGWNHYLFTLLDGTAWVSFKGKNQTSVRIHESHSSHTESHTESHSSGVFSSSEEARLS